MRKMYSILVAAALVAVIAPLLVGQDDKPAKKDSGDITVELAKARLRLAEAGAKRVNGTNGRVQNAVPRQVTDQFAEDVEIAKKRLKLAESGETNDFEIWLHRAQEISRRADAQYRAAVSVNKKQRGTFDDDTLDQFEAQADVARLQWEQGKSLVNASPEARLAWQVELTFDQGHKIEQELLRAAPTSILMPRLY